MRTNVKLIIDSNDESMIDIIEQRINLKTSVTDSDWTQRKAATPRYINLQNQADDREEMA